MSDEAVAVQNQSIRVGLIRAGIGVAQSIALYLLVNAAQTKTWPSTNGALFSALVPVFLFAPPVAVLGLSDLRPRRLIGWTLTMAVIGAALGWYSLAPYQSWTGFFLFLVAFGLGTFIAHCLVVAGNVDRGFVASYATYFDISWKCGVQLALAAAFTVALRLLFDLGGGLFDLINIHAYGRIIRESWFWIPVTTLAAIGAVHATDVRTGIVRSVQKLSCNLLSWLLPPLALICAAFLLSLAFTGLEPLWNTRMASTILLAAAASLILLINAVYQDGARAEDGGKARVIALPLRLAIQIASVSLVPLAGLAAYGIFLRVDQHGWSNYRVIAATGALVAACHALGYALAATRWKTQFRPIEATNVATALVFIVVLISLLTPVADPTRITVASQIARLKSGKILPEAFNYAFLRFDTGRYGKEALQKLAEGDSTSVVATRARNALMIKHRYELPPEHVARAADAADRKAQIKVLYPSGASLPQGFLDQDFSYRRIPGCLLKVGATPCDAAIIDLNRDSVPEIILTDVSTRWYVFGETDKGWSYRGFFRSNTWGFNEALRTGKFEIVPPIYGDIKIGEKRFHLDLEEQE